MGFEPGFSGLRAGVLQTELTRCTGLKSQVVFLIEHIILNFRLNVAKSQLHKLYTKHLACLFYCPVLFEN